jgi:hypothetical protein
MDVQHGLLPTEVLEMQVPKVIVLLDAKASWNALLDLCVLHNMKTQHDS